MQLITTSRLQEITATLSEGCGSGLPTPTRGLNFMWPVHAGSMNGGADLFPTMPSSGPRPGKHQFQYE